MSYGLSRGNETRGGLPVHLSPYHETPLSKIEELIALCGFVEINFESYNLVDLGGGKGISTLFFADRCNFQSLTSIELQNELVEIARKTLLRTKLQGSGIDILFINKDASNIRLENRPYFIFAYNPFSPSVMDKFIEKNLDIFAGHEAIFALYTPRCLNIASKYCYTIGSSSSGTCLLLKFRKAPG